MEWRKVSEVKSMDGSGDVAGFERGVEKWGEGNELDGQEDARAC